MAKIFKTRVDGAELTITAIAGFKAAIQRRIVRSAMTKAARIIAKEAKARAPKESGLLKKSIGQVVRTYRGTNRTVAVIGPRRGFRQVVMRKKQFGGKKATGSGTSAFAGLTETRQVPVMSNPVVYANLVEFGTEPHRLGRDGKGALHPGTPAQPFMRTAFQAAKSRAEAAFRDGIREGMEREARKPGEKRLKGLVGDLDSQEI